MNSECFDKRSVPAIVFFHPDSPVLLARNDLKMRCQKAKLFLCEPLVSDYNEKV